MTKTECMLYGMVHLLIHSPENNLPFVTTEKTDNIEFISHSYPKVVTTA